MLPSSKKNIDPGRYGLEDGFPLEIGDVHMLIYQRVEHFKPRWVIPIVPRHLKLPPFFVADIVPNYTSSKRHTAPFDVGPAEPGKFLRIELTWGTMGTWDLKKLVYKLDYITYIYIYT